MTIVKCIAFTVLAVVLCAVLAPYAVIVYDIVVH